MSSPIAGRVFRKERRGSVIFVAGGWTPAMVDGIQPPPTSTRFRVFYGTMATDSHHAGSEWIKYPELTPRQWIEATFPDYRRILSIVFDKA